MEHWAAHWADLSDDSDSGECGADQAVHRSQVVDNDANPEWDYDVLLLGSDPEAMVTITVFNQRKGRLRTDSPLGSISMRMGNFLGMAEPLPVPLSGDGAANGQLVLRCVRL
jgi:hypothetical protein